jgi:glycerate kinase
MGRKRLKIIVAMDSFKGSLSAAALGEAVRRGIVSVWPDAEVTNLPIGDGGEGTVDAALRCSGGQCCREAVTGPDGRLVTAAWCLLPKGGAVMEMAAASGLTLVPPEQRDPRTATTYGTGELLRAALDAGCRTILLGVGGSATNDGGTGCLSALGVRFLDRAGRELPPGGAALAHLDHIDVTGLDPRLADCRLTVACDVTNPLCGEYGASAVYGPQKGASAETVTELDAALRNYAAVIRRELGRDTIDVPGAGAAGGLAAGLLAFCGAEIQPGIETILDFLGFDRHLRHASLVITGEGRMDAQTAAGKAPMGVARRANAAGVPTVAITGSIGPGSDTLLDLGLEAIFPIADGPMTLQESMARCEELTERCAARLARALRLGDFIFR